MDRSSSLEEVEFRRQETKDQGREHEDSSEDSTVKVKNEGDINSMLAYLVERVKSLEKQVQQQSLPEDRSEISSEEDDNMSVNSKWLEFLPVDRSRWNSTKASDQAQGRVRGESKSTHRCSCSRSDCFLRHWICSWFSSTTSLSGVLIIAFRKSWTPTTFETPSRSPTAKKRRIASH